VYTHANSKEKMEWREQGKVDDLVLESFSLRSFFCWFGCHLVGWYLGEVEIKG